MDSIILLTILEFVLDKYCKMNKKLGYNIMFTALVFALTFKNYVFCIELVIQFIKYEYHK